MEDQFIKDALQPIQYIDANGQVQDINPTEMLKFDNTNIPFETQANAYFLVSRLSERKRLEFKDMESQLDAVKSKLYLKYVGDDILREAAGGKKPPEAMINSAVVADPKYQAVEKRCNALEYQSRLLNWLGKAIEMKSNLMISASAEHRQYMKTNPMNSTYANQ